MIRVSKALFGPQLRETIPVYVVVDKGDLESFHLVSLVNHSENVVEPLLGEIFIHWVAEDGH